MSTENCTIDLGCKVRNPLFHTGTSQRERLLAALSPDYIKADEHTLEDLLIFAAEYAKQLNYYSSEDTIEGDWQVLIESDPTIVLARIAVTKIDKLKLSFEDKVRNLLINYGSGLNHNNDVNDFAAVISEIVSLARMIDGWYAIAKQNAGLKSIIEEFVFQRLSASLIKLIGYDKGATVPTGYAANPALYANFSSIWGVSFSTIAPDSSIYIGVNDKNKVTNAMDEIRLIFNIFYQALSQMVAKAESLLAESLTTNDAHKPHIALFITFLRLFRYGQDDLNTFTKKHLDYYYKEVLRLSEKQAEPDKVFLLFELAQNVEQHLIATGTQFEAGEDALGNEVVFASTRDVVLNKGTIVALNTVFAEKNGTDIASIYAAAGADTKNGLGEEKLPEGKFWPVLGESQSGKTSDNRSMQDARVGFAVSSPLLFLKNGVRTISVVISPTQSEPLKSDEVPGIEVDIANSLLVYFTSTDGFVQKKPNRVRITPSSSSASGQTTIASIEIELVLDKQDPEVTSYDASIHGDTFTTKWPLLKFVFANVEASIVPYSIPLYDDSSSSYYAYASVTNPTNTYVLKNGVIYKLIAANGNGKDPETTIDVWKKIENTKDLVADLDAAPIDFATTNHYQASRIVRVNSIYYYSKVEMPQESETLAPIPGKLETNNVWIEIVYKSSFGYNYIKTATIQNLQVTANVKGVTDLILHSEDAALDHNKPFTPFGSNPDTGSPFYIGNTEIFQKQLTSLTLNIVWDKLPEVNFKNYYLGYESGITIPTPTPHVVNPTDSNLNNSSFRMNMDILDNGRWVPLLQNEQLFDTLPDASSNIDVDINPPAPNKEIAISGGTLESIKRDPYIDSFDTFDQGLAKGFVRFTLQRTADTHPVPQPTPLAIRAFGHKERGMLFTERIINKSTNKLPDLLPNEPYTPLIKECTIDYTSTVTIQIDSTNPLEFENRVDQFFHVQPFGQNEIHRLLVGEDDSIYALPQFKDEGTLYIGLDAIDPLQNITLLFQFKEGTEDTSLEFLPVVWSYLSNDRWFVFPSVNIVYDGTSKLSRSGIVELSLPEAMTKTNTSLPSGFLWVKVGVTANTRALNQVLKVGAQSIEADFVNVDNDPQRLSTGLPAKTIQDLVSRDAEIDTIVQPFASFDGKVQEESSAFYNRVSERLRHKSRAIDIWDYERLVLENFPSVYRTKCLNHTSTIKGIASLNLKELLATETQPGFVTVVVIPQLRDFITQEIFEPKVGIATIASIKEYLSNYISPFVQLEVENALYERVQAEFEVVFKTGLDKAFYTAKLNEDINQFLAPWAFDSTRDITFGGRLQKSVLINFIEERSYVDFVLHFHLKQQSCIGSDSYMEVDEALARTSRSVLSSAGVHLITALEKDEVACDDGIGSMIMTRSFITR